MADNDRVLYCVWNVGAEATEVKARALDAVHNVGAEATEIKARALYAPFNVGHEAQAVIARALFVVHNVGVLQELLARALYAVWAVILRTGITDPLEIRLRKADRISVERILRGK